MKRVGLQYFLEENCGDLILLLILIKLKNANTIQFSAVHLMISENDEGFSELCSIF